MKRTRLRPISKKKRRQAPSAAAARMAVRERSGGLCEGCRVSPLGACNGRGEHVHHLLPRSAGGTDDPSNLIHLSNAHHAHVHNWPNESYELGLLRRREAS